MWDFWISQSDISGHITANYAADTDGGDSFTAYYYLQISKSTISGSGSIALEIDDSQCAITFIIPSTTPQ